MRVLSIRQPWASLIASGQKSIELRSWATNYRGPVLIVSGSQLWKGAHGFDLGPMGVSICVVDLVDCRPATPDDTERACVAPPAHHYAWELRNPRPVERVPVKGKLGLYRPDATLALAWGL